MTDDVVGEFPADLRELLDSWVGTPAFVRDRHLQIVASNALARAVSPMFVEGVNLARTIFVDSDYLDTDPGAPQVARAVASALRDSLERHEPDEQFLDLVGELKGGSGPFAGIWDEGVTTATGAEFTFATAAVGSMRLMHQELRIPDQNDYTLIVMRAADEASRVALARLAELTTGESEA